MSSVPKCFLGVVKGPISCSLLLLDMVPWCLNVILVTCFSHKKQKDWARQGSWNTSSQPCSRWPVWVPFPFKCQWATAYAAQRRYLCRPPLPASWKTWVRHHVTMTAVEFVGEMAARQQVAVEPYMLEPESDPEQEEAPEESQQPRMNMDVSQWLVVKIVTSTLLLCYCIDQWSSTPICGPRTIIPSLCVLVGSAQVCRELSPCQWYTDRWVTRCCKYNF